MPGDTKISALSDGGSPAGGDLYVIARSGQNYHLPPSSLDQIAAAHVTGGDVSLNSHKLTNVLDPTTAQDAATKHYVDAQVVAASTPALADVLGIGNDAGTLRIINMGFPTTKTDAATKEYGDSFYYRLTGADSYTVALADQGHTISCLSANPTTVSFDSDANTGWGAYDPTRAPFVNIRAGGAGIVTVQGINGVVVSSRGGILTLAGTYSWATAIKTGANTWDLVGDLG